MSLRCCNPFTVGTKTRHQGSCPRSPNALLTAAEKAEWLGHPVAKPVHVLAPVTFSPEDEAVIRADVAKRWDDLYEDDDDGGGLL